MKHFRLGYETKGKYKYYHAAVSERNGVNIFFRIKKVFYRCLIGVKRAFRSCPKRGVSGYFVP